MAYESNRKNQFIILSIYLLTIGIDHTASLSCFKCHGTSISEVSSSCWESVNPEHTRFVSEVGCDGGSCSIIILNHTSVGLVDFTRDCERSCQDGCITTPFGTILCKHCCTTDRCNAIIPHHKVKKYDNDSMVSTANLEKWMRTLFSKMRHHSTGPSVKVEMRGKIWKLMKEFSSELQEQKLVLSETHADDRAPENFRSFIRTSVLGFNLIGILPGTAYKTAEDEVVVVMAHYDTFPGSPGVNDNGSGMSVLLELARLLKNTNCSRQNTIIFVATDFKEHGIYRDGPDDDDDGSDYSECIASGTYVHNVGSSRFVCKWLLPHFQNYGGKLAIAVNLDTVMNVDYGRGITNRWPKDILRILKSYQPYGKSFLSAATEKRFDSDWWMVKSSTSAFEKMSQINFPSPNLKNEDFVYLQMNTSEESLKWGDMRNFLYADDCAPYHEIRDVELPCMTVSDTGKYRGYMKTCYHTDCDTMSEIDDTRLSRLVQLTNAVMNVIRGVAKSSCISTDMVALTPDEPTCNLPLIKQTKGRNNIFISATCIQHGESFEMCSPPVPADDVWAVLNGDSAWIPRKVRQDRSNLWFQVDFTEVVNIIAIALQGVRRRGYVRSYIVSYSNNERDWDWLIPDVAQFDDVYRRVEFRGNDNARRVSKQSLSPIISARFIRIQPKWWKNRIAMRIQIYGCRI